MSALGFAVLAVVGAAAFLIGRLTSPAAREQAKADALVRAHGTARVRRALTALLGSMWTGTATDIGLTTGRSDWFERMRRALEAADEPPTSI